MFHSCDELHNNVASIVALYLVAVFHVALLGWLQCGRQIPSGILLRNRCNCCLQSCNRVSLPESCHVTVELEPTMKDQFSGNRTSSRFPLASVRDVILLHLSSSTEIPVLCQSGAVGFFSSPL